MGKKRAILMDESQEQELNQRTENKYKSNNSYDLPDEFAELEALYAREEAAEKGEDLTKKETKSTTVRKAKVRSKKFLNLKKQVDRSKLYSLDEAIKLMTELAQAKFKETVELHVQSKKDSVSGSITLPHGSGKEKKVAILDDKVLKAIEDQKTDFDVLIAKPEDMAKLAKHAKYLGPRGLMPNPKRGTISTDPEKAAKEFGGGKVHYKSEKKAPLVHLIVGKVAFGDQKIKENVEAVFAEMNAKTLRRASICSSMGPGIKLDLNTVERK